MCFYDYAVSPKDLGLKQSKVDPCVFFRKCEKSKPEIIVIFYAEDCCIMGKPEHVDKMKNKLRKDFGIVQDGQLSKLLVVQY